MDDEILERRMAQIRKKEQKMLEEHGWFAHLVPAEDGIHANHHTHGVLENFQHLDFQVTLHLDPRLVHSLLGEAVENVKRGVVFFDNERSPLIIRDLDVLFKEFEEGDRTVLRIILPDPKGCFPTEEGCEADYLSQLDPTYE